MIHASTYIVARAGREKDLLQTLRSLLGPISVATGCLGCRLSQDCTDQSTFVLVEIWHTRADLDRHIRSKRYRSYLEALELAAESPEIRFSTIEAVQGMELIDEIRGKRSIPVDDQSDG